LSQHQVNIEICRLARIRSADNADFNLYLDSQNEKTRHLIWRLLTRAEIILLAADHSGKIVDEYTEQPIGCNNVQTLVIGKLVNDKMAPRQWSCRITLNSTPRIIIPVNRLNPIADKMVDFGKDSFSPMDNEDFLANPDKYVSAS
jgi:hypothetical protein